MFGKHLLAALTLLAVLQLSHLNVSGNRITGTLPSLWSSFLQASIHMDVSVLVAICVRQCIYLALHDNGIKKASEGVDV